MTIADREKVVSDNDLADVVGKLRGQRGSSGQSHRIDAGLHRDPGRSRLRTRRLTTVLQGSARFYRVLHGSVLTGFEGSDRFARFYKVLVSSGTAGDTNPAEPD